jgi:hypothetical protein
VKYPEAIDWQYKSAKFLQLDLPEIGALAPIFLQIHVGGLNEAAIAAWMARWHRAPPA